MSEEIQANDIDAVTDLVKALCDQAENLDFQRAAMLRAALGRLKTAVGDARSFVERDMLRQVEKNPRVVTMPDGQELTFLSGKDKTATWNHELILDRAWKKAFQDSMDEADGTVDWDRLGQAIREIFTGLYLAPSTRAKSGGLEFIGLDQRAVVEEKVKGRKLIVMGDDE